VSEPWVCFEDEHLLAVAKPAGVNTHRPDTHAQDGMYEWVQRQRPLASLSILHRLDKGTSGLLVFGKSADANQSLSAQFEGRSVAKRYELVVARDERRPATFRCDVPITQGSSHGRGVVVDRDAATDFERLVVGGRYECFAAHPHTGRTHQVRLHATAMGMPIVGDIAHEGVESARLFLHAAAMAFEHPTGAPVELSMPRPPSFELLLRDDAAPRSDTLAAQAAHEARAQLFDPLDTDAYLWMDRHHDGFPGVRVERLGDVALVIDHREPVAALPTPWLDALSATLDLRAIYQLVRPRGGGGEPARLVRGTAVDRFEVTELGRRFVIDLGASATSSGLFLDQRETRRQLGSTELAGATVLNTFAHTGSLSVAAAAAGAETLTLDLSQRYLDWARENLRANGIDPADHDFVFGDALEWMDRFAKKRRVFDVVLVDPPSSSTTRRGRSSTRWSVERDLAALVARGARLCAPGGTLFVSTNLRRMPWTTFLAHVDDGLRQAGREGVVETQTLPLDHRSGAGDPPYLKAAWITLDGAAPR
jgi:23S rRNA (cytosine1962-C5)-methyltransferase